MRACYAGRQRATNNMFVVYLDSEWQMYWLALYMPSLLHNCLVSSIGCS
jgi:hypothetical protein